MCFFSNDRPQLASIRKILYKRLGFLNLYCVFIYGDACQNLHLCLDSKRSTDDVKRSKYKSEIVLMEPDTFHALPVSDLGQNQAELVLSNNSRNQCRWTSTDRHISNWIKAEEGGVIRKYLGNKNFS